MTRLRKWLNVLGSILVLVLIIVLVGGTWFVRNPWPQVSGTITIDGLSAPVQIIRDNRGIPQIYAESDHDLFFAQGFVHAQDRLWQMEFNRRIGSGTLSSAVGAGTLETDRFLRTLGFRRAAEKDWEALNDDTRAILESYAAGVNAYIETNRNRLPIEFTILGVDPAPWTPIDSLTWGKVMSLNLGFNYLWEVLRARLIAELGADAAYEIMTPFDGLAHKTEHRSAIPPEVDNYRWFENMESASAWPEEMEAILGVPHSGVGSNSWVVHGSRTVTGKPILANDTHLYLNIPSIWYANGLHGGRFNTVGFSFPGVPLVIIGHNDQISWGITNLPADVQDLYIERLDDLSSPTQYEYEGEWFPLNIIEETIDVKDQESVPLTIRQTRHGPLINDVIDGMSIEAVEPMSLKWTAFESSTLLQAISMINRASDWDEFRAGGRYWESPNQNVVYADVDGNIGYQMLGAIPTRMDGHVGDVPVPGWTSAYEWQEYIPFEDLPSSLNPPEGYLATANSKPTDDEYPYHLASEWAAPYRIQRINELLSSNEDMSIADMKNIQAQTYSVPAADIRPYLLAIEPENDLQRQALEQVQTWDLLFEADRVGATIYATWFWFLIQNMLGDELGEELLLEYNRFALTYTPNIVDWMAQEDTVWFDDITTPEQETRDDLLRSSLDDALTWLQTEHGDDMMAWQWGRVHPMEFVHQPLGLSGIGVIEDLFNSDSIPARGDDHTVNAGWFSVNRPFRMIGGTAERLIIDLNDLDATQAINSTGQSAHLFHRHREDTIEMWQNMEYYPLYFSQEAIENHGEQVLWLQTSTERDR